MSPGPPSSITPPALPVGTPADAWRATATEFIGREAPVVRHDLEKVDKVKSFFDVVPLSEAQAEAAASAEADAAATEGGRKSVRCCSAVVYFI